MLSSLLVRGPACQLAPRALATSSTRALATSSTRALATSSTRALSTTSTLQGMIVFSKMQTFNKRGPRKYKKEQFRKWQKPGKYPDLRIYNYGCRGTGVRHEAYWEHVPEMVPELVVPDLSDTELKPYVSYKTKDIYQEELTAKDLFNVIYGQKIMEDYKAGRLDSEGNPLEPSAFESLTPQQARMFARQTGSDVFDGGEEPSKFWRLDWRVGRRGGS